MANNTVTIQADVIVTDEHELSENSSMTHERVESREFVSPVESYKDLSMAMTMEPVDILAHFTDGQKRSHGTQRGWAVDVTDRVTVAEHLGEMDVEVDVYRNSVYDLATESGEVDPVTAFDRLRGLATSERTAEAAVEAFLSFLLGNMMDDPSRRPVGDDWEVPSTIFECYP